MSPINEKAFPIEKEPIQADSKTAKRADF